MLHEFVTANREELVRRCLGKISDRDSPSAISSKPGHGIPIFLGQLVEALRCDELSHKQNPRGTSDSSPSALAESSRAAALQGKKLLEDGYTVDEVVFGYGDVCQAITELAGEINAPVTIGEFHTLNRMLDNAIADAVTSYGRHRDSAGVRDARDNHERSRTLADEQCRLLDTALAALDALKMGNIGMMGATGTVLEDSLRKARALVRKS